MRKLRKSIIFSIIGTVYLVSTSIFAHLIIMDNHHSIEVSHTTYQNTTLTYQDTIGADSSDHQRDCTDIEAVKITSMPSLSAFSANPPYHAVLSPNSGYNIYLSHTTPQNRHTNTGPPRDIHQKFLSFTDLVGVIVLTC